MDEEKQEPTEQPVTLGQLREELDRLRVDFCRLELHLLAISQALGALPWRNKYEFEVKEHDEIRIPFPRPHVEWAKAAGPYSALDRRPDAIKGPPTDQAP